jgi:UDPglucose 6-dehydrogenase
MGQKYGAPQNIVETVVWSNAERQRHMAEIVTEACGGDVKGKKIGILGIAFKPNTDDIREAPSLVIIPLLQEEGAIIAAHDPAAMDNAAKELEDVAWYQDPYEVVKDADILVIITEWNEFRALDMERIAGSMKTKTIVDMRNIYRPNDMKKLGFTYISIGRPAVVQDSETQAVSLKLAK